MKDCFLIFSGEFHFNIKINSTFLKMMSANASVSLRYNRIGLAPINKVKFSVNFL